MIFIEIDSDAPDDIRKTLRAGAEAVLHQELAPQADLSLVLADDERLRALNLEFLGKDAPTDVLSFPSQEIDPETNRRYLGDVIISVPQAARQARSGGHALEQELQLLVVHGVLHLLGHDHATQAEKLHMWKAQAEALESLGLPRSIVHE